MEVITTHLNADFDAFGSMVAAKKLYPNALVAFPGSQEKSLRDFFMESALYILAIERAKNIDLDKVKRLIVVDTRQKSRIGRFASLVDRGDVEIHLYDHHPDAEDDLRGHLEVVRGVGSTVTLLSRELRERGIDVNAEEATVMALGIYEDTGSFTFPPTTPEDLDAAAWLLEQGANLNIVSDMMTTELGRDQVELLYQLIEETEVIRVGGLEIMVSAAGAEGYVGDIAVLVHKYRDMENPDAIFALIRMENRVHLVARSRVEEVNAGEIAAEFGGGGHTTAASATIKDLSLYEARDKLIKLVKERVTPRREARQIMTRPVVTIEADKTLFEAATSLSRYQVSSLPVLDHGSIVGILHRDAVDKAMLHGLQDTRVRRFMTPDIVWVRPEDSVDDVLQVVLVGPNRLAPVIDNGELVGVISRTDLLQHLKLPKSRDAAGPDSFPDARSKTKSVKKLLHEMFPERVLMILLRAGEVASSREEDLYLVGGAVRDILLRNRNLDIDMVIEGAGIDFARQLASELTGCRVRGHEKFGTAVILFDDGFKIDVASARYEYYASPGALPTVEMSSIKRDLYRRDFTMNTLAVSLMPDRLGEVIDFFGGARDIKDRVIRVLHNLAFVEDPTRILRALRFSHRFGFTIGKHTYSLMEHAIRLGVFEKVEGLRLLNELKHILDEKNPVAVLEHMEELGLLKAVNPTLQLTSHIRDLLISVSSVLAWWKLLFLPDPVEPWVVYALAITNGLSDDDLDHTLRRFSIPEARVKKLVVERVAARRALSGLNRGLITRPSELVEAMRRLSLEAILFMMSSTSGDYTRMRISEYVTTLRYVRPLISGQDLIEMGYAPGRIFSVILKTVRDARMDKLVETREEERELVARLFPLDGSLSGSPAEDGEAGNPG